MENYKNILIEDSSMKKIIIEETKNGQIILKADKGIKWSTFITGMEMMFEEIENQTKLNIDDVLRDIKRIYERDKKGRN